MHGTDVAELKVMFKALAHSRRDCVKTAQGTLSDLGSRLDRVVYEAGHPAPSPILSDDYLVPATAIVAGTGTMAGSLKAREAFNKYFMPASNRYADLKTLTDNARNFAGVAGASEDAAPYLYAELGHKAVQGTPMRYGTAKETQYISPGEAAHRARYGLLNDIRNSKFFPKSFKNLIPTLEATPPPDTIAHYGAFATSPLEAYMKMVEEVATPGTKQFNMQTLKEVIAAIVADSPVSTWNEEFSRRLAPNSAFLAGKDALLGGSETGRSANITPFIRRVLGEAGVPVGHNLNAAQIEQALSNKGFFAQTAWSDNPTDLIRSHISSSKVPGSSVAPINTLADLRFKPHPLQELLDPLMSSNFRNAARTYGRYTTAVNALRRLGGRGALLAGAGLAGTGALVGLNRLRDRMRKRASHDRDNTVTSDALIAGGVGSVLPVGLSLQTQLQRYGLRGLNPLSPPTAAVIGGVKDMEGVLPGTPMDSFSSQSNALAQALERRGVKVEFLRGHTAGQVANGLPYRIANPDSVDDILKRVNAVIQVGAQPAEYKLDPSSLSPRDIVRYRALTDFGPGNLQQPKQWLGSLNWMGVHDNPKSYTRFIVPGGESFTDMPDALGQRANINTAGMPVQELFSKGKFNVPPLVRGGPAKAFLTVGGGAGGFTLFDDVIDKARSTPLNTLYDYDRPNVLDDILAALKMKHGDQANLQVLMGNITGNKGLEELRDRIMTDTSGRWKGSNFMWDPVKQEVLRDMYAGSHYTFASPGSTAAEYMAMSGKPGRFISLVPNETHAWMPKHYSTNAQFVEKHLPLSASLQLNQPGPERVKHLLAVMGKASTLSEGELAARKGLVPNFDNAVRTIKNDIIRAKLGRMGRAGLLAGIPLALLGGGMLLKRHNRR